MFKFNYVGKEYKLELINKEQIKVTPRDVDARYHAMSAMDEVTYGKYYPTISDLLKALSDELEGDFSTRDLTEFELFKEIEVR